jgi:two-component system chemotaxis sensor kinase CheA
MELAHDITSEDLQVFLQEADEHLQLLDEDFVRLEREKENPELLQEIFRVAHTLKGSAAMLGHQRMADLAHSMENVLDKVRKGDLPVTTQVVDALLHSLDSLTLLKEELISTDAAFTDIAATIAQLEIAEKVSIVESEVNARGIQDSAANGESIVLTPEAVQSLTLQLDVGFSAYQIHARLKEDTAWAAVRCFQILETLSDNGTIIASAPTQEDVEAEHVGLELRAIVVSRSEGQVFRNAIEQVDEIAGVDVQPYELSESASVEAHMQVPDDEPTPLMETLPTPRAQSPQTVRIDVERLDDLMNLIGELVIDRTRIVQIGKMLETRYRDDELVQALGKTSSHIEKVVDELQESTMKVRMLPIGTVFSGFPRMMRDLAQKVYKKVDFVIEGQDTEIDRTVIDRIRDPLVHLLRNSVDHGLETPEERRQAGKPETGTVRLSAIHEQGHIVITVEDDGRGIDARKVRESAVSKGMLSSEAASRLSDSEALNLIFLPGASTAAKTTDISGRGVGMDIVKSNIEAINGFVNVKTKVGEGTRFTLRLPLTLATLQALLVSLNDTAYAIPLVYVLEAVAIRSEEISTVERNEVIRLRGKVIPLIRLRTILGIDEGAEGDRNGQTWVVVVKFGERLVGIGVDALIELQEIVVRSLGRYIGNVKGVAGASILGDGKIVLILDISTLMGLALQVSSSIRPEKLAARI